MTQTPNLPRGVQAFLFESAERRRRAEDGVVRSLQQAGFSEVLLPVLDFASPYAGVTAEGDERLYRFLDRQGELLALRADFTPMAARVLAPRLSLDAPVPLFYRGDVVRDEPAGVGRPREFAQVGAELYGDASFDGDLRVLRALLAALGDVPAPRLTLALGYAGLLEALLAAVAPSLAARTGEALAALARAARERRVTAVESGLLAAGAPAAAACELSRSLLSGFDAGSPLFRVPVLASGVQALRRAAEAAATARPGLSVVLDLAGTPTAPYYTGLTFAVHAAGARAAVAGGGRYDELLGRFGRPGAAVGFSVGLEALVAALDAAGVKGEPAARRPFRIAAGKGRLLGKTLAALREAGVDFPEPDGRRLVVPDATGAWELLLLKDDDVPTYVAHGGADAGIVGSDRIAESGEDVFRPVEFPFGVCRLALIGRAGEPFHPNGHPVLVGTKYVRNAARYFDERRIAHEIVPLAGSVELAAALRLTDVIVDLIETGATLKANGLAEIETILESRATLIVGPQAVAERRAEVAGLVRGLVSREVTR